MLEKRKQEKFQWEWRQKQRATKNKTNRSEKSHNDEKVVKDIGMIYNEKQVKICLNSHENGADTTERVNKEIWIL